MHQKLKNQKNKMQSIDDILKQASLDTLGHLGRPVFVRGVEYIAIVNDDQYPDESGLRRDLSLSFEKGKEPLFERGDSVYVPALPRDCYKFGRMQEPDVNDPFFTIELKNA
jgi:hypothetical protein